MLKSVNTIVESGKSTYTKVRCKLHLYDQDTWHIFQRQICRLYASTLKPYYCPCLPKIYLKQNAACIINAFKIIPINSIQCKNRIDKICDESVAKAEPTKTANNDLEIFISIHFKNCEHIQYY